MLLSLFRHVITLCDTSHTMVMAGRSVPEAVELSGGKRNLSIGRWAGAGAGAGVGILPPVYCYPEPPLAKLPPSLVCPSFSTGTLLNTSWQLLLRKRHTFKSDRVRFLRRATLDCLLD